jgi:hypothetical protein
MRIFHERVRVIILRRCDDSAFFPLCSRQDSKKVSFSATNQVKEFEKASIIQQQDRQLQPNQAKSDKKKHVSSSLISVFFFLCRV